MNWPVRDHKSILTWLEENLGHLPVVGILSCLINVSRGGGGGNVSGAWVVWSGVNAGKGDKTRHLKPHPHYPRVAGRAERVCRFFSLYASTT